MLNPKIRIVSSSKFKDYAINQYGSKIGSTSDDYIEIGGRIEPSSKYYLMNYQFSESVNNFSGNFSVSIYEDVDTDSNECIFSKVKNLDIVYIYEDSERNEKNLENNDPVFIGIVHQKNMQSMMNNGKVSRVTRLDGNGVYSLVGDLSVSLDIHSLTGVDAAKTSEDFTRKIESLRDYPSIVESLWDSFISISKDVCEKGAINSTIFIDELLGSFFIGSATPIKEIFKFENMTEIRFPVVANFWTQSVNKFSDMIRTLLPSNIFEIFGCVESKGKPVLKFREMPFSPEAWKELPMSDIDPLFLTGYSISQSDSEVYNAFLAYIEGSNQDAAFSLTLGAIENRIEKDTEKMAKYGYRPLQVNFRGYNRSKDFAKDEEPKKAIKLCAEKMKEWYGSLDELYSGTINLVRGVGDNLPKIGERIKFINYEFYVTDKTHSWGYGNPITVTLNVSRGAYYNSMGQRDTQNVLAKEKFGCRYAELKNINS
ncbi:MAG: hypothetical protein MJZ37_01190 [Bacilli bacterium]|nr:hypothetical protein [Bacilli bacterium]